MGHQVRKTKGSYGSGLWMDRPKEIAGTPEGSERGRMPAVVKYTTTSGCLSDKWTQPSLILP